MKRSFSQDNTLLLSEIFGNDYLRPVSREIVNHFEEFSEVCRVADEIGKISEFLSFRISSCTLSEFQNENLKGYLNFNSFNKAVSSNDSADFDLLENRIFLDPREMQSDYRSESERLIKKMDTSAISQINKQDWFNNSTVTDSSHASSSLDIVYALNDTNFLEASTNLEYVETTNFIEFKISEFDEQKEVTKTLSIRNNSKKKIQFYLKTEAFPKNLRLIDSGNKITLAEQTTVIKKLIMDSQYFMSDLKCKIKMDFKNNIEKSIPVVLQPINHTFYLNNQNTSSKIIFTDNNPILNGQVLTNEIDLLGKKFEIPTTIIEKLNPYENKIDFVDENNVIHSFLVNLTRHEPSFSLVISINGKNLIIDEYLKFPSVSKTKEFTVSKDLFPTTNVKILCSEFQNIEKSNIKLDIKQENSKLDNEEGLEFKQIESENILEFESNLPMKLRNDREGCNYCLNLMYANKEREEIIYKLLIKSSQISIIDLYAGIYDNNIIMAKRNGIIRKFVTISNVSSIEKKIQIKPEEHNDNFNVITDLKEMVLKGHQVCFLGITVLIKKNKPFSDNFKLLIADYFEIEVFGENNEFLGRIDALLAIKIEDFGLNNKNGFIDIGKIKDWQSVECISIMAYNHSLVNLKAVVGVEYNEDDSKKIENSTNIEKSSIKTLNIEIDTQKILNFEVNILKSS
ncbi:MAG: hypothetical protein MHPSP_000414 [Paramarteilia canceri]